MCEYDSKLIKLVIDDTPKAILGLIIVSSMYIWIYLEYIPFKYLLLWTILQVTFVFLRYFNAKMLAKYNKNGDIKNLKFHIHFFNIIVIYSSIIWSLATILGAYFAPTPYEFISLAMIMGIITASVISLTPIFNIFLAYFFIMILSQLIIMLCFGTRSHLGIALFLFIYMPVIVLLAKSIYKNHLTNIETHEVLKSNINELRELSITDSLTKVYNRRYFFESAQTLLSIAKRENHQISFLMLDIDYFKNINDTYGHQVGDKVLIQLSQKITSMIRDSDLFARIGGEEFGLILNNTSLANAKISAEKIRSAIEKINFNNNLEIIDVTVSIGCSSINNTITTLEELYQEADKKLYLAKESGRNRVQ
jgi:diguanylate cyclase (GGDEF)-like protein